MPWLNLKQGQPIKVLANGKHGLLVDAVVVQTYGVGNRVMAQIRTRDANGSPRVSTVLSHTDVILTVNMALDDMRPAGMEPVPPGVQMVPIPGVHSAKFSARTRGKRGAAV